MKGRIQEMISLLALFKELRQKLMLNMLTVDTLSLTVRSLEGKGLLRRF